jgi:hypothetical protein
VGLFDEFIYDASIHQFAFLHQKCLQVPVEMVVVFELSMSWPFVLVTTVTVFKMALSVRIT